jgi:hypothetical protein
MNTDDLKSRRKTDRKAIIITLSICALLGFHYYRTVAVAFFYSPGWPKARGNVIKSYVRRAVTTGGSNVNVMPEVVYIYSVDGVDYRGNRIFFLEDGTGSSWSQKKAEKYKVEQQIEVYYNPQDPSISVLEPGGSIKGIFLSGAFHFILIGALLVLVFACFWDIRKVNRSLLTIDSGSQMT